MPDENAQSGSAYEAVEVLLIEDDVEDALLIRELFEEAKIANPLHVVEDGVSAMRYLRRLGEYSEANLPDLILLDLNLPGKDGREILNEMKSDPAFANVQVVILTASPTDAAILEAYHLNVSCYLTKPVTLPDFLNVVRKFPSFRLLLVRECAAEVNL